MLCQVLYSVPSDAPVYLGPASAHAQGHLQVDPLTARITRAHCTMRLQREPLALLIIIASAMCTALLAVLCSVTSALVVAHQVAAIFASLVAVPYYAATPHHAGVV